MAPMSPRCRLLAAMRREEVDKVPCSPRLGVALNLLYGRPGGWVGGVDELALQAADEIGLDPHFVVGSGLPLHVAEVGDSTVGLVDVRCTLTTTDDGPCHRVHRHFETPGGTLDEVIRVPKPGRMEYGLAPNPFRLEPLVKGPDDLPALRCLLPDPARCDLLAAWRAGEAAAGEKGLVEVCIRSPIDHQAGLVCAMEELMVAYHHDRPFFDALVGLFYEQMMRETQAVLEGGCRVIFGSWYYTSLSVGWSPALFREVFLPMIRAHVDLVHQAGGLYDYYDDGHVMGILDMVAEAGVDCFETLTPPPVGDADLAAIKARIGDRVCLKGYVDLLYVLKHGTPELVRRTVREALETAGPTGFILGTSDSIREGTPRENVEAYFLAAQEYGPVAASRA